MEEKLLALIRNEPLMDQEEEVVRIMTEKPPAHCILKIDSFSVFHDALSIKENHFKSTEFSSGGYTWVLSVYPKGNKKEQVDDDHLSVYVTLVDQLAPGSFVDVVLRFFLYDHLRDAYLSVLDVREKRFHALKDTWGVSKFLPTSTFKDAEYGFLVNDCCVFGAEVLVINNHVKISTMSIVEDKFERRYSWKIENFASLDGRMCSPEISFNGCLWKLVAYPRGEPHVKGKYMSLFLQLDNSSGLTHGNALYVEYFLYLKNQRQGIDQQIFVCKWFTASEDSWGYPDFVSLGDLHDPLNNYLVDDTLIVEVFIEKMFMLTDMKPIKQE